MILSVLTALLLAAPSPELSRSSSPAAAGLVYSTYVGDWYVYGLAVDAAGSAYVVGTVVSPAVFASSFPEANGVQKTFGGGNTDAFVAKISPDGGSFAWATYLGGSSDEIATAVAVDPQGNVVVAGRTFSSDFPIKGGFQDRGPAFVTRISADGGRILYSTRFGGSGGELIDAMTIDAAGSIYIAGEATSTDFPAVSAFQPARRGPTDAFVAKIDPAGKLAYATLLGGDSFDEAFGIAVDSAGRAFVTGYTYSENFPVGNGPKSSFGGSNDGFLAILSADGATLLAGTYFGGSGREVGHGVAIGPLADGAETLLLVGSQDPPNTPSAFGAIALSPDHAPEGSLAYETLFRFTPSPPFLSTIRSLDGELPGIAMEASATASGFAVAGQTGSPRLATKNPIQAAPKSTQNLFLQEMNFAGDPTFSSYFGSSGKNAALGVAAGGGDLWIAGSDDGTDLEIRNGIPGYSNGNFVARIDPATATRARPPTRELNPR